MVKKSPILPRCRLCHRVLIDADSIKRGTGPVCDRKGKPKRKPGRPSKFIGPIWEQVELPFDEVVVEGLKRQCNNTYSA